MTESVTEIERLLIAAATDQTDQAATDRFLDALLESTVYWLIAPAGDGWAPLSTTHNAKTVVPFFSTPELAEQALANYDVPQRRIQQIGCRALWGMALQNGVLTALNPFSQYGKEFLAAEMSDLLQGIRPGARTRTVTKATTLMVGAPSYVPPQLIPALTAYFNSLGSIVTATLAWVRYPDGLEGYLLVIVTDLPREQVLAGIDGPTSFNEGATVDITVEPSSTRPHLAESVAPFYRGG